MTREPVYIPRLCTEAPGEGESGDAFREPRALEHYRETEAYVLLGDPGSGKTRAFREEAKAISLSSRGHYVTGRDLITFGDRPEWHGAVLFIDGLDEIRAGSADRRRPLDQIRRKLERLRPSGFRLSCREADWLGDSDRRALEAISPTGAIKTLHLEPLGDDDVREFLRHEFPDAIDAEAFLDTARDHGLAPLLGNPQTLLLLAKAVTRDGQWPRTRQAIYEAACTQLARELNPEHEAVGTHRPGSEALLEAAGFVCAVQIIGGVAGVSLLGVSADDQYPVVADWHLPVDGAALHVALASGLFRAGAREVQREPVHRTVAEFLAARYLAAERRAGRISRRRLLALILGGSDRTVTALRGLAAWLATLDPGLRIELIDCDPVGVLLYGDGQAFALADKRRLLRALHREAERDPWFLHAAWNVSPLAALCDPGLEEPLREVVESPARDESSQSLALCAFEAIRQGGSLPGLLPVLLEAVRDTSRARAVRARALEAALRTASAAGAPSDPFLELLTAIASGEVEDSDDELFGILLRNLYPEMLTPEQVIGQLRAPRNPNFFGAYQRFFTSDVLKRSSPHEIARLLDALASTADWRAAVADCRSFSHFLGRVIVRGLETLGDSIDDARLRGWLEIGLDNNGFAELLDMDSVELVRQWLSARPERYKAVFRIGLFERPADKRINLRLWQAESCLYRAAPPSDLGRWCLSLAESSRDQELAEALVAKAVCLLWQQPSCAGFALDDLHVWTETHPRFKGVVDRQLYCDLSDWRRDHSLRQRELEAQRTRERDERASRVERRAEDLRRGDAPACLLHVLGTAYFGLYLEARGESPRERLLAFLGPREEVVEAALAGLRRTVDRADLPTARDVLALRREGRQYHLERPFLAGLEELSREREDAVLGLGDERLRLALTLHRSDAGGSDEPAWLAPVLRAKPRLVAEVVVETVRAALRRKAAPNVYSLAYDDAYAEVARHAVETLLRSFPTRAPRSQLECLEYLLTAGLRHLDPERLRAVIGWKLARSSLTTGQRALWLAASLIVDPDRYAPEIARFASRSRVAVDALGEALRTPRRDQWDPYRTLPPMAAALFIELLGSRFPPYRLLGAHWVSPAMEVADRVQSLIDSLGQDPSDEAAGALARLAEADGLDEWAQLLRLATIRQAEARREALFQHPDPRQVSVVLAGGPPAGSADLLALTLDLIDELARDIRDANTDDWKQFWNVDSHGRPDSPKPENECRNVLLARLRDRLRSFDSEVELLPEARFRGGTRADVRVSFGGTAGFNVPIEIKHEASDDLWTALHGQLAARYATDPGADGHGIYVVFWFGAKEPKAPPRGVCKPSSAQTLEDALRGLLACEERRRLAVRVIDCSPDGSARSGAAQRRDAVGGRKGAESAD